MGFSLVIGSAAFLKSSIFGKNSGREFALKISKWKVGKLTILQKLEIGMNKKPEEVEMTSNLNSGNNSKRGTQYIPPSQDIGAQYILSTYQVLLRRSYVVKLIIFQPFLLQYTLKSNFIIELCNLIDITSILYKQQPTKRLLL